jgi:hypothetical protein
MSEAAPTPPQAPEHHGLHPWVYWTIGAVVVVLMVIGVITYSSGKDDRVAKQKAEQLTQKLTDAGLPVPENQDVITSTLGTDGGAVCDNPLSALGKASLFNQLTNGAAFVGQRPIIADKHVLQGEALILQTYCPDKFEKYQDKINDLKTDNTIKR